MGLAGFGMPWEEGEDAWVMLRRPDLEDMTKTSDGGGPDSSEDVPAEMLADDDSKFVELEPGLKVRGLRSEAAGLRIEGRRPHSTCCCYCTMVRRCTTRKWRHRQRLVHRGSAGPTAPPRALCLCTGSVAACLHGGT